MNPATRRFALDIVDHILRLHTPEKIQFIVGNEIVVSDAPVLYKKFGKRIVQYYFSNHKENIETFCSHLFEKSKISKVNYCNRVENVIEMSRHYDQCFQVFYNLCIKLTLLGFVAKKKGITEALSYAIQKIDTLAAEAYIRGDLDEKFDCMFNFACDLLSHAFSWSGCNEKVHWDLEKVVVDSNACNYYDFYLSYFKSFFSKNGNTILNEFSTTQDEMTREIFIFQIQDWSDAYYGQLGKVEPVESLAILLETFMNISLLTVHAVKLFFPSSIRLAHESMVKLAISADKHGLWTNDNREKLRDEISMEF